MKKTLSVVLGFLASIGTLWVLNLFVPNISRNLIVSYGVTLLSYTFAFGVGGVVAGRGFRTPAVALVSVWIVGLVLHTAYLADKFSHPVVPVLTYNLPIIGIAILSSFLGASIGVWCSDRFLRYFGSAI